MEFFRGDGAELITHNTSISSEPHLSSPINKLINEGEIAFHWNVEVLLKRNMKLINYYNSNYMTIIYKYKFML